MSQQLEFDLSGYLPVSAQIGMKTAEDNADARWYAWIGHVIFLVARQKPELTVDDVVEQMEAMKRQGINPPTNHSLDALGPAMMRARKAGVIKSTGKIVRGKRPESHGNRHSLWESMVWVAR